jgi:hypothetical protein
VVYADVGLTADGKINWKAPIIDRYQIPGLPYYVVLDEAGAVAAQGDDAYRMAEPWMAQ